MREQFIERGEYLRQLRAKAAKFRVAVGVHATSRFGTQGPAYEYLLQKAEGYDLLADTIEEGSIPLAPKNFVISKPKA